MFVVFDMDGTLTDPSHRLHYLQGEKKDWDAFYEASDGDLPKWPMINSLATYLRDGHVVHIWTGRRESVRGKTIEWLDRHDISNPLNRLVMRKDGDFRHDTIVKGGWLEEYGIPDLVFEDRNSMVELYRSKGIMCAQVAPGDF